MLRAGSFATVHTRSLDEGDHLCGNEPAFYPPLTETTHAMPVVAITDSYRGPSLGRTGNYTANAAHLWEHSRCSEPHRMRQLSLIVVAVTLCLTCGIPCGTMSDLRGCCTASGSIRQGCPFYGLAVPIPKPALFLRDLVLTNACSQQQCLRVPSECCDGSAQAQSPQITEQSNTFRPATCASTARSPSSFPGSSPRSSFSRRQF